MMSGRLTVHVFSEVASSCGKNGMKILSAGRPDIQFTEIHYNKQKTEFVSELDREELHKATVLLADVGLIAQYKLGQDLPNLRWMQATWAGVDALLRSFDKNKALPGYQLTRFGGALGPHMAEYVIGHIIGRERNFPLMRRRQDEKIWCNDEVLRYRRLSELRLGILGCGDIGADIAKAAKCFGMSVWGLVRRDLPEEERCEHVDRYMLIKKLPVLLENCDYVCNVLPSTPETKGFLSGDVLSMCKEKKPVLINIGRGDVIDEPSLVKALSKGWLSGAILDVFEAEPLPDSSALWSHSDVTISPHVAGTTFPEQSCELFLENLERYLTGKPLKYLVDINQGY